MGKGEGLGKGLETFSPRGEVPAPHRLALYRASLVRSCSLGGCGTYWWSDAAVLPACSEGQARHGLASRRLQCLQSSHF